MNEWQPIETAPDNGRQVLFYLPAGVVFIAPSLGAHSASHTEMRRLQKEVYLETGEWPQAKYMPTHWMPIPAPPPLDKQEPCR